MIKFMLFKFLSSPAKSEIVRISFLFILLGVFSIYFLRDGLQKQTFVSSVSEGNLIVDLTALKEQMFGQRIPVITVHEAITQRQGTASFDSYGILIFIPANTCMQQQASTLKHFRKLHENLNDQVPFRLILLNNDNDGAANRYKSLLLRKAVRPNFDIWYADNSTSFAKTVLDKQLGIAILVKNHKVIDIFYVDDHDTILRSVSNFETLSSSGSFSSSS